MLVIETNKSGKWRQIDLHALPIGKTFCHQLSRDDLFREAQKLGVPGIAEFQGWQDLALAYGNYLCDQRELSE